MEFVLERSIVKANIYGQEVELKRPTKGMIKALNEKREGKDESEQLTVMEEFMAGLGMPQALQDEMELSHYLELIEFLCQPKKK